MLIAWTNTRLKGYNSRRKTHEMDITIDQLWLNARLKTAEKSADFFYSVHYKTWVEWFRKFIHCSVKSLGSSLVVLTPLFSLFFVMPLSSFFTLSTMCLITFQIPLHKCGKLLVVKLSKSKVVSDKKTRKKVQLALTGWNCMLKRFQNK